MRPTRAAAADRRAGSGRAGREWPIRLLGRSRLARELHRRRLGCHLHSMAEPNCRPDRCAAQPSRAASASASATSVRSRSDGLKTYSDGVWAPFPRGPSPSTVSGIARREVARVAGAAAGASRRSAGRVALPRPSAAPRSPVRSPSPARDARRLHRARRRRCCAAPTRAPTSNARWSLERMSNTSSPAAGTTLIASPEAMIVGTTVRRSGPSGSDLAAPSIAASASASSAFAPRCGADPECAERPLARTRSVVAALRLTTTPS